MQDACCTLGIWAPTLGGVMKRIVRVLLALVLIVGVAAFVAGCDEREADRVSYNVSVEADNFNVTRRLVVTNVSAMAGPSIIYEMVGNFSINTDNEDGQLEVTAEVHEGGKKFYTKHFIRLNEYTTYVVEDMSGADVSPYKYELNFLPEMIVPIKFKSSR